MKLRLTLAGVLCAFLAIAAWAQQPINDAQVGGQAVANVGVNGIYPMGGYASQNTSDAAWTSATSVNTRVTQISNVSAYNSILVTLVQGSTITGGVITLQQSNDNSNWIGVQCVNIGTTTIMGPTYTLVASTNVMFLCPVSAPYFGVLLSTAISGSGTVTVGHNALTLPNVGLLAGSETLAGVTEVGPTTSANTKTNPFFDAPTDGTNVITAAISALGIAPTGTEVQAVNAVQLPSTASGVALSSNHQATLTTPVNIKSSTGNVYGLSVANGAAAVCWVQFINASSGGTLGTNVIFSVALPSSGTLTLQPGTLALGAFSNGISVGIASSTDSSTACGTGGNITVFYE